MNTRERIAKDVFYLQSVPRLAFTDNMYSITSAVYNLGLKGRYHTSAFWYQGIEDLLEKAIEKEYKYGLTIDYDTWFMEQHVIDLYELMEAHPELIALFPLQPGRAKDYPMAGTFLDPEGHEVKIIKSFEDGICYCDTGHFGLTLFRLDKLKELPKPWLWSKPSPKGSPWGKGKKDADVNFWLKCKKKGFKVAVAEVYIGHIQIVCSFTRPEEKGLKTQYVPITAIHEKKLPPWVEPKCYEREKNESRTGTNENRTD